MKKLRIAAIVGIFATVGACRIVVSGICSAADQTQIGGLAITLIFFTSLLWLSSEKWGFSGGLLFRISVLTLIAGLILSITLSNMTGAIDRGMQKRTLADMRAIATAIEEFSVAHPRASWRSGTYEARLLKDQLVPAFIKEIPANDAWGNAIWVAFRQPLAGHQPWPDAQFEYTIRSAGACGEFESDDPWSYENGPTNSWSADIVFSNGKFVRYPQGVQR